MSILTVPQVEAAYQPDTKSVWLDALAHCESGASTTIKILDTNNYYSYGKFQFQMSTWLKFGKPFGATKENIFDGELQGTVARSMLDADGKGNWYYCSQSVEGKLGEWK